jgi:hypothetical protein
VNVLDVEHGVEELAYIASVLPQRVFACPACAPLVPNERIDEIFGSPYSLHFHVKLPWANSAVGRIRIMRSDGKS